MKKEVKKTSTISIDICDLCGKEFDKLEQKVLLKGERNHEYHGNHCFHYECITDLVNKNKYHD